MTTRLDKPTLRNFAWVLLILTSSPTTALAAQVDSRAGAVVDRRPVDSVPPINVENREPAATPAKAVEDPNPTLQKLSGDVLRAWCVSGAGLGLAVIGGARSCSPATLWPRSAWSRWASPWA